MISDATHSPPSEPSRGQFIATVRRADQVCREHVRLSLRVDRFPQTSPGQFIQISCRDVIGETPDAVSIDWEPGQRIAVQDIDLCEPTALLRRPFSLAGRKDLADGTVELTIISRDIGIGTHWLSKLKQGDHVDIIGPLGNRFILPEPTGIALLVGGGVGIPPMLYLASMLANQRALKGEPTRPRAVAFCGALTRDLLPLAITADAPAPHSTSFAPLYNVSEFATHNIPAVLSTDDGSYGFKGYVTDALTNYLDAYLTDNADRARTVVYTCGPEGMMKRVADIAERRGIACQVAVERAMACGMGTCQSCCIRVHAPASPQVTETGKSYVYKLACTDGPVFDSKSLLW